MDTRNQSGIGGAGTVGTIGAQGTQTLTRAMQVTYDKHAGEVSRLPNAEVFEGDQALGKLGTGWEIVQPIDKLTLGPDLRNQGFTHLAWHGDVGYFLATIQEGGGGT